MRAQFGLTTLIIFIALIVTAAVAAGVIIYTTQTMQQQALQTGAEAKQRVSTGIEVVRVLGYQYDPTTASFNTGLQKITVVAPIIRLMSGSNPINFNDLTLLFTTEKGTFFYVPIKAEMVPEAVHARLEGGNVFVTGFVYGNSVNVKTLNITDTTVCSNVDSTGYIVNTSSGSGWCEVTLNVTGSLTLEEAINLLNEMKTEFLTPASTMLLAMSLKGENIHLEEGEIYEILIYGAELYPEENYELQIIPKGGYPADIQGRVPTVLQAPVEDIWAK